ncbi:6-aminohexanoate-dimer hydrolase [Pseudovibrio axinellae]|uniref:6-aminohexanoate-dimer hydrolase n=1 Tax=Pseudovibrio axinellae TaxID=989403 RepID=A0A165T3A5_9HYPH|nr:6-aminohexanoate-dimer hydrolase [Pseudovibrio axinellae]SER36826.1 CubicO group peptidase, beta-lactamase class C family [Pseudovibrio axinellae]
MRSWSLRSALALLLALGSGIASAQTDRGNINDFYRGFELSEITPENMQLWPYYKYTSTHWDEYGLFGTTPIMASATPATLTTAEDTFDIGQEFQGGRSFVASLLATQTKGFLILKDNLILGEFYDNFLNINSVQLLQSSSKTYAGIIASKLIDDSKIDPAATVENYLPDFKGSGIGKVTIQHVLDMQAGLLPASDYHVPGGEAYVFETEQGLKPGEPTGHRKAVIAAETSDAPGEVYNYNDKNTDLLAMLAESVTGQPFNKLLSNLYDDFGANSRGSIALTVDGTASPSYGISATLRDYALFHQWIAQGKAPQSFYVSIENVDKDLYSKSEGGQGAAALLGTRVTYASQAWYLPEHDIIYSLGSYGQVGISHRPTGMAIVFMQDWEDNGVPAKYKETIDRALFVLAQMGQ